MVEKSPGVDKASTSPSARETLADQFGLRGIISEYLIPVETNTIWYTLGGVLGIALAFEILTGFILTWRYIPDAGKAFGITASMLKEPFWSVVLNFHYWSSYLIFGLVMIHMMRVLITGGYLRGKQGLWLLGVALAGIVFLLSITGETLHWDERGFAVPWHISELLDAVGLAGVFQYTHPDLKVISIATEKLIPIYAAHVAVVPLLLLVVMALHYYVIRVKKISLPFWLSESGRKAPFTEHVRAWLIYGGIILGVVLVISFISRDPGPAPQLLPSSPFFGSKHGPGTLGITPTYPISWTHGMNRLVAILFNLQPDIWGTVIGAVLMLGAVVAVPFVDRAKHEPRGWAEAFDLRQRGWVFLAIGVFWVIMIAGVVTNAVTPIG
jgi:quinol-cytochrome oxidoreductase complex cytochrome b subunit